MGTASDATFVHQLSILSSVGAVGLLPDGHLLQRFLDGREDSSGAAFAALVDRHGPMVLRVCRQVLGDEHDAVDAQQATFLVLARKAGSVRKADSVASWLHGVARRISARARSDAIRRKTHERRVAEMKEAGRDRDVAESKPWAELHEEIARLPERYREPIVLCYLEGMATEAAAERLGCPRGTILSRLSRGRERLRARLTRRGLTPASVPLLVEGLAPGIADAVLPVELVHATVRAALGFARSEIPIVGNLSDPIHIWAHRALRTMLMTKLKMTASLILAVGALAVGVATLGQRPKAAEAAPIDPGPPPAPRAVERPKPEDVGAIPFQKVGIGADDLVEASGLDIYKFQLDMPKGLKFKIILRELDGADVPARVLHMFPFEKLDGGSMTLRVSFLRRDRKFEGFLLSQEKEAEFRVDSPGCNPSGIASFVPLPLAGIELTRKTLWQHKSDKDTEQYGLKETRLLTIVASEPGKPAPPPSNYPRAELVIVKDAENPK
jgi:RNA polymerase sigma factor (sigma-70 family)